MSVRVGILGPPTPNAIPVFSHELFQCFQLSGIADGIPVNHGCSTAVGVDVFNPGPFINDGLQQCVALCYCGRLGKLTNHGFECAACIANHGLAKVVHFAVTVSVRQRSDIRRYISDIRGDTVSAIDLEPDVGCRLGLPGRCRKTAELTVLIAIGVNG